MRAHPHGPLERLVQDLAEGRVRVDHHGQLPDRGPSRHGVGALLDQVGGVDADDVHPDDLLRLLVEEDLRDPRALALGQRLAVRPEAALALCAVC